jgi:2-polyprenyl-3-methyl-5-hydroxy-6-metoxy-1,4-benzoquinol methylase
MRGSEIDQEVARFWDRESRNWGEKYGGTTSYFYRCRTFREFFGRAGLDNASILDYGCGSGDITFPMVQIGHTVTGVDIADGMVGKAAQRAAEFGLTSRASYHHLDHEVLAKIAASKFDAVICSSVLEYVDDDRSLLRMFHDVLNDQGVLIVSVPDRKSLFCRLDKWIRANERFLGSFIPVEKLGYLDIQKRQYDIASFVREVEGIGFELVAKRYNSITLQRGLIMEKISNIPGIGMLAIMMFRKSSKGRS